MVCGSCATLAPIHHQALSYDRQTLTSPSDSVFCLMGIYVVLFSSVTRQSPATCHTRTAGGQAPKRPRYTKDKLLQLTVLCISDPANRHSRNSVSNSDIKSNTQFKAKTLLLTFYVDLFYLFGKIRLEKAGSFR